MAILLRTIFRPVARELDPRREAAMQRRRILQFGPLCPFNIGAGSPERLSLVDKVPSAYTMGGGLTPFGIPFVT